MVIASVLLMIATAFTNINQIVNVQMTSNVVSQLPQRDYTTPHMTLLSHERALREGNLTNQFDCCTEKCNCTDVGVGDVSQVPMEVIRVFADEATNGIRSVCVSVRELLQTDDRYVVILKDAEIRNGIPVYEWFRYELVRERGGWKVDAWEPIVIGESSVIEVD